MTRFQRRLFAAVAVGLCGLACTGIYVTGSDQTRDSLVFMGAATLGGVAMYWLDQVGRAVDSHARRVEQQRHALATAGPEGRVVAERPHEPGSRPSRGSPDVTHPVRP